MNSIKWKIIWVFLLLQIGILTLIGIFLTTNISEAIYDQMERGMQKEIGLLRELLLPELARGDIESLKERSKRLALELQGRITVIAEDGTVLVDTEENPAVMENHLERPEVRAARQQGTGWALRYSSTLGIEMKYLARRVEPYGYVRLAIPATEVQHTLVVVFGRLLLGIILAFALFVILAWRFSESITAPIERITNAAQKIAHGNLGERIHIYTRDEIGTLSRMFNLMAVQLADTIKNITSEKERLATILENMADGLVALDPQQRVILLNPAAEKIFGVKEVEVKGKALIEVSRNQQLTEAVREAYETRELVDADLQIFFPQEVVVHSHIAPIIRENLVHGMVLIFTDMTELKRLERLRTEFVANVSHELKTPLTSIRGYVETLLDMEMENPLVQKFLAVINKESERLGRLINDLLDLSRLENRRHHQLAPVRLQNVVDNVMGILVPEAEKKHIDLTFAIPTDLPQIMGSEEQLNQVLINLTENAIKYTPANGKVTVSAGADTEWVTIQVADNGVGISVEDLDRIFERFYRVDKARSRQAGGTGLGLSIVKHIVKAHGGDIWVESQVGVGSTFGVKFKRA